MNIEIIDPSTLTLNDAIKHQYSLYYITKNPNNGINPYNLKSLSKEGLEIPNAEYILCKIIADDEEPEAEPLPDKKRDKPAKPYERLTYRCETQDASGNIFVDCRPDGTIRVNFKDKESAKAYMEYIRELFYHSTSGTDYLTVFYIFKELRQVDIPDDARKASETWGYPTLDGGECRYISEVAKTRDKNMFGFTLKRPQKLYGVEQEAS